MMQRLWLFILLFVTKKTVGDFHFALPGAFACRYMCFCECAVSTPPALSETQRCAWHLSAFPEKRTRNVVSYENKLLTLRSVDNIKTFNQIQKHTKT